jgi:hypothetical protein
VIDFIGAPGEHSNKFLRILDDILSKRSSIAADVGVLAVKKA